MVKESAKKWLKTAVHGPAIEKEKYLSNKNVSHYTSAEVAINILRYKEIWMRNAYVMNDYSEIQHGEKCLEAAWQSDAGKRFWELLDQGVPGLSASIKKIHLDDHLAFRSKTHIACFSEHGSHESNLGRLSMWRAYGGENSVALVFKPSFLFPQEKEPRSDAPDVNVAPVFYQTPLEFTYSFKVMAKKFEENLQYLGHLNGSEVANALLNRFRFTVLSTKHPGFIEEKEIRLIVNPGFKENMEVNSDVKAINGVPQIIYKFTLDVLNDLDHIIIGPCRYPVAIFDAFVSELSKIGFKEPKEKVVISEIPLRR
ncbi:DUF2971 domain-containing protein [Teichococcus aestuarii]|uniref:DUF2971 domain-containing protein n=1 Tax=Teichococcus aestuarii TaxID=568898 RepID=A0A2U1V7E6_9PROT|nr:DUF2971 domain-containing protein [Pseudoroseomonas aestuarii]PWC29815.1 hypothetical protein CR165_05635 [Pseudoroseomonas aestuarii]